MDKLLLDDAIWRYKSWLM